MIGQYVLVRTYSAGVHMGLLKYNSGTQVELTDARRLWYWKGANTLSEISQKGVGTGSKISEQVPVIVLTEAIELIPCSDMARENLNQSKWG